MHISDRMIGVWLMLLAAATVVAAALDDVRSIPMWLLVLGFASVALSEMFPVKVGQLRYSGSDFALWLAIAVVGPWPALVLATVGVTLESIARRVPVP